MSWLTITRLLMSCFQLLIHGDSYPLTRPSLFLVLNSNNNLNLENAQEIL